MQVRVEYSYGLHIEFVKVAQDTELIVGYRQIITYLSLMSVGKFAHSFQFYNDFIVTDKVCDVLCIQFFVPVIYVKALFSFERNVAVFKFIGQSLLIDFFKESHAEALVYLEYCSDNLG